MPFKQNKTNYRGYNRRYPHRIAKILVLPGPFADNPTHTKVIIIISNVNNNNVIIILINKVNICRMESENMVAGEQESGEDSSLVPPPPIHSSLGSCQGKLF